MKNKQKGAASGIALGMLVVVLLAIVGIGWVWKNGDTLARDNSAAVNAGIPNTGETGYSYVIDNSTSTAATTQSVTSEPRTETRTYTTYERRTVPATRTTASAYTGITGANVYHNSTYGLTLQLPSAGWRTYVTSGGPAGLSGTAQIHFIAPGESTDSFVVNVWNKEQWTRIRTLENYVHLNTSNIGEGTYLGENFTWIYSYTIYSNSAAAQSALSGAVFY